MAHHRTQLVAEAETARQDDLKLGTSIKLEGNIFVVSVKVRLAAGK